MSRVEENQKTIRRIAESIVDATGIKAFNKDDWLGTFEAAKLDVLIDISKSLAVIADSIEQKMGEQ